MSLLEIQNEIKELDEQIQEVESEIQKLKTCPYNYDSLESKLSIVQHQIDEVLYKNRYSDNSKILKELRKQESDLQKLIDSVKLQVDVWRLRQVDTLELDEKLEYLKLKRSGIKSSYSKELKEIESKLDISKFITLYKSVCFNSNMKYKLFPIVFSLVVFVVLEFLWTFITSGLRTEGFFGIVFTLIGWCCIPLISLKIYPILSKNYCESIDLKIVDWDNINDPDVCGRSKGGYHETFIKHAKIKLGIIDDIYNINVQKNVFVDSPETRKIMLDLIGKVCKNYVESNNYYYIRGESSGCSSTGSNSQPTTQQRTRTYLNTEETMLLQDTVRNITRTLKNQR